MVSTAEENDRQVLPTATGFAARQTLAFLRTRNVAFAPLLRRAGLSERDIDNRPTRISAAAQSKLLEYAAEAVDDSAFGLHLAERVNPRAAGLLFYVASAAINLGQALALYERYFRIVNEAVRLKLLRTSEGVVVEFNFPGLSRYGAQQNAEFGISVILMALREAAGRNLRPTRAAFTHARNSYLRAFERFDGCPVEFAASSDQLAFSNKTLALPLFTGDPYLLETLRTFCDEAAKERNTAKGSLRATVEDELQRTLPHGKAHKALVAKQLAMSTRTLSRRLADESTSYEEVVDQLRRSLALQYIKDEGISFSQIAWLLGYEGSTSFNHAFLRWTGRSPSAARKGKLLRAPA
jgi:AraC-like DNA-binding protein